MTRFFHLLFVAVSPFLITISVQGQELEAYRIYNEKGEALEFGKMASKLQKADVVLFGEFHDNPICHWLQFEFTRAAMQQRDSVVLGAEMFETDDQLILNEYLSGAIEFRHLEQEAKLWPNFETDYRPLVDLAKDSGRSFIATNVPRRYASIAARNGVLALDSLSNEARAWIAPLPFDVTINDHGYIEMREQMGFHGGGLGLENIIAAQALKDYTMAWNIHKNLPAKGLFIHYNGSFHSQKRAGIYNYLKALDKRLDVSVVAVVEDPSLDFQDEWKGLGDFIIVIPTSMTKTH